MRLLLPVLLLSSMAFGQTKLAQDAPNCQDSRTLPKLLGCRIDNCEKRDGDRREVNVKDDATETIDGDSRLVMYECAEGTTPKSIVSKAADELRAAGFDLPYVFKEDEGALTAHKDDLWITIDSASRFYTLTELKVTPPDFESINDAASMAEAIEKYGHVPVYGVHFFTGKADIAPESVIALRELAIMLDDNPEWNVRIEGHTDNVGTKEANGELSARRANAVTSYLVGRGIKRTRLQPIGMGDTHPIAPNDTDANRAKNRRVEVVLRKDVPDSATKR